MGDRWGISAEDLKGRPVKTMDKEEARRMINDHFDGAAPESKFGTHGVIQTASGEAFNFENPDPKSIKLDDIAHALGNACRFAGHTRRFYSVAEHCVLVSRILEAEGASEAWQRVGLMHDAHEAYVWDCPRPLKPLIGDAYAKLAAKADAAICRALNLPSPVVFHEPTVKHADDLALVIEAEQLMHTTDEPYWQERKKLVWPPPEDLGDPWLGLLPDEAKRTFLSRAERLGVGL